MVEPKKNDGKAYFPPAYLEGDPMDALSASGTLGLMNVGSIMHAIYLSCVKPYVQPDSVVLEIGPGKGAWTRGLLAAKELWCLDALSAEDNQFFEYLGHPPHARYFQVSDFECKPLPDDHFTYLFSYGCFCHLTLAQVDDYARHLFPKLRRGAHAFWMYGDYDKLNAAYAGFDRKKLADLLLPDKAIYAPLKAALRAAWRLEYRKKRMDPAEDPSPRPGRWYHTGVEGMREVLEKNGFTVLQADLGLNPRDPIVHFVKP